MCVQLSAGRLYNVHKQIPNYKSLYNHVPGGLVHIFPMAMIFVDLAENECALVRHLSHDYAYALPSPKNVHPASLATIVLVVSHTRNGLSDSHNNVPCPNKSRHGHYSIR